MSPLRTLRQILRPTGRRRAVDHTVPLADLLDEAPAGTPLLDNSEFEELLAAGDIEANECAPCPACCRTTFHAMHADGSRKCWTCGTTTAGDQ